MIRLHVHDRTGHRVLDAGAQGLQGTSGTSYGGRKPTGRPPQRTQAIHDEPVQQQQQGGTHKLAAQQHEAMAQQIAGMNYGAQNPVSRAHQEAAKAHKTAASLLGKPGYQQAAHWANSATEHVGRLSKGPQPQPQPQPQARPLHSTQPRPAPMQSQAQSSAQDAPEPKRDPGGRFAAGPAVGAEHRKAALYHKRQAYQQNARAENAGSVANQAHQHAAVAHQHAAMMHENINPLKGPQPAREASERAWHASARAEGTQDYGTAEGAAKRNQGVSRPGAAGYSNPNRQAWAAHQATSQQPSGQSGATPSQLHPAERQRMAGRLAHLQQQSQNPFSGQQHAAEIRQLRSQLSQHDAVSYMGRSSSPKAPGTPSLPKPPKPKAPPSPKPPASAAPPKPPQPKPPGAQPPKPPAPKKPEPLIHRAAELPAKAIEAVTKPVEGFARGVEGLRKIQEWGEGLHDARSVDSGTSLGGRRGHSTRRHLLAEDEQKKRRNWHSTVDAWFFDSGYRYRDEDQPQKIDVAAEFEKEFGPPPKQADRARSVDAWFHDFDESQVKRDEGGKFSSTGGGGAKEPRSSVSVRREDGKIEQHPMPDDVIQIARGLKDAPERYFNTDKADTQMIPVDKLVQKRARPEGIANAAKYMKAAYNGEFGKRDPIFVQKLDDGNYLILDGNSTTTIATLAGWDSLPAIELPDESHLPQKPPK